MSEKRMLSDLPFFETVQEILSHYSNPPTCPAICCKVADINLDENDLDRLRQAPNYDADNIETCGEGEEYQYKINPPCPFLESDRCSVYEWRPTICRMFPFNLCNVPDVLLLFPCDMGADILKDYAEYSENILKQPIHAKTINDFEQSHHSFESKLIEGLPIPMLMIKIHTLTPFNEYLRSKYD